MFKISIESEFNKKSELISELENLIWQVKHTWPVGVMSESQIKWIKSKVCSDKVKLSGGSQKINIEISNTSQNKLL